MNKAKTTLAAMLIIAGMVALGMAQETTETFDPTITSYVKFKGVRFCNCVHIPPTYSFWWTPCSGAGCVLLNGTQFVLHNHLPLYWSHGYGDGDYDSVNVINVAIAPHNCGFIDYITTDLPIYIQTGLNAGQYPNEPEGYYIIAVTINPVFWAFGLTFDQMHGEILNQAVCGSNYLDADFGTPSAAAHGGSCKIVGVLP